MNVRGNNVAEALEVKQMRGRKGNKYEYKSPNCC